MPWEKEKTNADVSAHRLLLPKGKMFFFQHQWRLNQLICPLNLFYFYFDTPFIIHVDSHIMELQH